MKRLLAFVLFAVLAGCGTAPEERKQDARLYGRWVISNVDYAGRDWYSEDHPLELSWEFDKERIVMAGVVPNISQGSGGAKDTSYTSYATVLYEWWGSTSQWGGTVIGKGMRDGVAVSEAGWTYSLSLGGDTLTFEAYYFGPVGSDPLPYISGIRYVGKPAVRR